MRSLKINKKIILERIDIIQKSLEKLNQLKKLTPGKFMLSENFAIAEHYLRYALEATFDICAHILLYRNFYREQKRERTIYNESLLRAIPW
jgi:uncharacterized protein YutE (UPF0331/DUF86 family)